MSVDGADCVSFPPSSALNSHCVGLETVHRLLRVLLVSSQGPDSSPLLTAPGPIAPKMVCRTRIVCGWCAFVPLTQAGDKVSAAGVSWRIILRAEFADVQPPV